MMLSDDVCLTSVCLPVGRVHRA